MSKIKSQMYKASAPQNNNTNERTKQLSCVMDSDDDGDSSYENHSHMGSSNIMKPIKPDSFIVNFDENHSLIEDND